MDKLYKNNMLLEIVLFIVSVIIINVLLNERLYWWVAITAILIISLEVFIKIREYNPIIKIAQNRECKIKELEDSGITNHYIMHDYESKKKRNLKTAKEIDKANEMSLIAETAKSYLDISTDRHWRNIKKKLNLGISFKVLLLDPNSVNKKVRNNINNPTGIDRKLDIEGLIDLHEKYESLEIRFTDQVYCSLFYTDKYMIYDPYHLGKISDRVENNFIAIEFNRDNRNYNILKSHFDNCWRMSKSFEEVVKDEKNNTHI